MWIVRAFVLGALAVGALVYVTAATVALAAGVGGQELHARLGPLVLVSVQSVGGSTSSTLGPGLVVIALVGGLANLGAAAILARRSRVPPDRIH